MARRLIIVAVSCAVVLPLAGPAGATRPAEPTTPVLIERAADAGDISRRQERLFIAYALTRPNRVPPEYRSSRPWDGTLPLLRLRRELRSLPQGRESGELAATLEATECSSSSGNLPNTEDSTHFHIQYDTIGGGLGISQYKDSLEASWTKEVDTFGWAAPPVMAGSPPPGNRYHVRIDDLGSGLYGFVSASGTYAGFVGNNPNTSWNEGDAFASCMVLNSDYSGFPSTPQASLDSTTAHEFNHSIQFGYGGLTGSNVPDDVFIEGGATWMEDEVHDSADDNHNYLWPDFDESMGDYDDSFPYPYWIALRGITERYGTGVAGGGEQVMQDFWEETSKNTGNNLTAMQTAVANRGTTLGQAFHAYAIAVKFNRACGGGYALPHCFEEGPLYVAAAGATPVDGTIASVGGSFSGSAARVEDAYALAWVALPSSASPYDVTLANTSGGGQLRGTVACDTGSQLALSPLPVVIGAGGSSTLSSFDTSGCTSRVAVITNEAQTSANPTNASKRSFTLSTAAAAPPPPQDNDPPETSIAGGPSGTTAESTPSFTFSSDETDSSFKCRVDAGSYVDCTSPYTTPFLSDGSHTFSVYAIDQAANPDPTPAERSFTVDTSSQRPPPTPEPGPQPPGPAEVPPVDVGTSPPLGVPPPDLLPPTASRLRLSNRIFRAARSGRSITAISSARVRTGTRMRFQLSEAGPVRIHVERAARGVRVGGRCVRPRREGRRCTRWVRHRSSLSVPGLAGRNTFNFSGRMNGRALRPARYRLVLIPRDAVGNVGAAKHIRFRIVP